MPRAAPIQGNFQGGEISPLMYGRVDSDRYKTGLAVCQNYIPAIQGGTFRRPGSQFVAEVRDSTQPTRLEKFKFSTTQAYALEFGSEYVRFYRNNGLITTAPITITNILLTSPITVTAPAHGFSTFDRVAISSVVGMEQVNGLEFQVTVIDVNTFTAIPFGGGVPILYAGGPPPFDPYVSGGTVAKIYEVATPYASADAFQLKFTQSDDVIYITHPSYPPAALSRTGNTSWTLSALTFSDGPYMALNSSGTALAAAASSGTGITLTASAPVGLNNGAGFLPSDVGRYIRLEVGTTWGWCVIAAFIDNLHVSVNIMLTFGTDAVLTWRFGLWSETTGYPSCSTFHEDRLVFGGSPAAPQRVDASVTSDYLNFQPTAIDGTVPANAAYAFSLNSNDVNAIHWLVSNEKGLLAGSDGGEWFIRPGTTDNALSATNVSAKNSTNFGSADIQALRVGRCPLFVQRGGSKLREMNYNFYDDGFDCSDMSEVSEHLTKPSLTQLAYQSQPQSIAWAVRSDGQLVSMTYERTTQSVRAAWSRHVLGGFSDAAGSPAVVESVTVIPSPDGTYDQVWVVVRRWIGLFAGTRRYVEVLSKPFDDTISPEYAQCLDTSITYDNPRLITGISQSNPAVLASPNHGFLAGDIIRITGVLGMTELNGNQYVVASPTTNAFQLKSVSDASSIDSTNFSPFVPGYLTFPGEARKMIQTLAGLSFLEGQTVSILGDGAELPPQVVVNGKITLTYRASVVTVGLPYNSDGQQLRLDSGAADGTAFGKTRRTNRVGFLVHRTGGLKFGMSFDELNEIIFRSAGDPMGEAVPLYDGIFTETTGADYSLDDQVCWRQSGPLPGMILAVMPQLAEYDRG